MKRKFNFYTHLLIFVQSTIYWSEPKYIKNHFLFLNWTKLVQTSNYYCYFLFIQYYFIMAFAHKTEKKIHESNGVSVLAKLLSPMT